MADELLELVLAGKKTATCWAARDGRLTHVGKRMMVCDVRGAPRAVVETTALVRRRFDEVNAEFAAAEGEGDGTLSWWRAAHRAYFGRAGGFSETMELWCETFRVVRVLRSSAGGLVSRRPPSH